MVAKRGGFFRQLWVLTKKNLLCQIRHPYVTIFEFLIPAFMSANLLIGRSFVETEYVSNVTVWDSFHIDHIGLNDSWVLCGDVKDYEIAYTPNTALTVDLVKELSTKIAAGVRCPFTSGARTFTGRPFETVEAMNEYVIQDMNSTNIFMGLVFPESWAGLDTLPDTFEYSLRPPAAPRSEQSSDFGSISGWVTNLLFPVTPPADGPRGRNNSKGAKPYYFEEGFLTAQHILDKAFMTRKSDELGLDADFDKINLSIQRFPFSPYPSDPFILSISRSIPFIILICFIYLGMQTAKSVAVEKDSGLKEYMLMMGLSRNALWTAHFLHYFLMFLVTVTLTTIVLMAPWIPDRPVIKYTDPFVLWIFLVLFGTSLITLGFMISTWFETANSVAATTCVFIFLFFLPYQFIFINLDGTSTAVRILCSLCSPTAMGFGFLQMSAWEGRGLGIQWANLVDPVSSSNQMTMLGTWIILIVDTLLYYAIARYIDVVNPGRWGVARSWYFLFSPSYWCPKEPNEIDSKDISNALVEPVPQNVPAGFRLNQVVKDFGSGSSTYRAIDNLSFVALQSEITVLLGHNGAGKSTTMNMLSGMLEPTKGECYVGDTNVAQNIEKARQNLGLCPQHNILIKELKVREHFEFFAQLKGLSLKEARAEIETLAAEVQLEEKINDYAYDLSGGMKRKLSLGIALCGNSTFLILDEPSSGIDVRARRELWQVLEKCRKNRTMLLSTHYMDEAEYLADRIVIISQGQLKCSGSSQFLKAKLGTGYHVTMSLDENAQLEKIVNFVQESISSAKLDKFYGKEATFLLPFDSSEKFPALFREIDGKKEKLGIQTYGISVTTIDEIFSKATSDTIDADKVQSSDIQEEILLKLANRITFLEGFQLMTQQFRGAFVKCALHAARNWKIIAIQLILPAIMTILAAVQIIAIPVIGVQDKLDVSLTPYGSGEMGRELDIRSTFTAYGDPNGGRDFVDAIGGGSNVYNLTETGEILQEWIPATMAEDLYNFNENNIIAMEMNEDEIVTYFNGEAYHSISSAVLYADRTILNSLSTANLSIVTHNSPLPATLSQSLQKNTSFTIQGSIISFNLVIGLMIMFSAFSMLPVRERATGVRTMQKCSGAPLWLMWAAEYVWDLLNATPPILVTMLVFVAFKNTEGIKVYVQNMDSLFVLMIMFALAQLPFGYCCSYFFDSAASALTYCSLINIALGLLTNTIVSIIELFEDLKPIAVKLDYTFCLFPQYNLARGLYIVYLNANIRDICEESVENQFNCYFQNISYVTNSYAVEDGGIGRYLISLGLLVPLLFGFLALIEFEVTSGTFRYFLRRCCRCFYRKVHDRPDYSISTKPDEDVLAVKQQVMDKCDELVSQNPLVVNSLSKNYGGFQAVDEISFFVEPNRCFGLLGPNGAGKTSLFKMLTGEHDISSGEAFINKFNVQSQRFNALREFGYCPQFDALLEQLTAEETLYMYARFRGVPEGSIANMVDNLLRLVGIESYRDTAVRGYSGGTKRKLSVAVALTGFPPVLIMDEPSCGLDPGARRTLWSVISGAQKAGAAVLLTSHSMEETSALCNSLAIMVNGRLKCIGGQQYLKSKFGRGVEVEIQINRSENRQAVDQISQKLPQLRLEEQNEASLKYQTDEDCSLGQLFEVLEDLKKEQSIEGYTVHQSTLEQIFLELTERMPSGDRPHSNLTKSDVKVRRESTPL